MNLALGHLLTSWYTKLLCCPHFCHIKALEQFQQRTPRAILGVCWQDQTTNASIVEQACTTSIEACLVKMQLSWAGHVKGKPDTRVPKQLLYAQLTTGRCATGGQQKWYKDQMKTNMKNAT